MSPPRSGSRNCWSASCSSCRRATSGRNISPRISLCSRPGRDSTRSGRSNCSSSPWRCCSRPSCSASSSPCSTARPGAAPAARSASSSRPCSRSIMSALLAPIMMMVHAGHVLHILFGFDTGWEPQRRDDGTVPFRSIVRRHRDHVILGVVSLVAALLISPSLAAWMSPTIAGLILAIVLSWSSGLKSVGFALRRAGLLVTPEEQTPPPIATRANALVETARRRGPRPRRRVARPPRRSGVLRPAPGVPAAGAASRARRHHAGAGHGRGQAQRRPHHRRRREMAPAQGARGAARRTAL